MFIACEWTRDKNSVGLHVHDGPPKNLSIMHLKANAMQSQKGIAENTVKSAYLKWQRILSMWFAYIRQRRTATANQTIGKYSIA